MQFIYTDVLDKPVYMSVCCTITVSVQPVWPTGLQRKMLLHISVQCRTATQLLPHFSTRNPQTLFSDFATCRPPTLPVICWYYILQDDAWFPTILTQPSLFLSLTTLRPHSVIH